MSLGEQSLGGFAIAGSPKGLAAPAPAPQSETTVGREPLVVVEIDQDRCLLRYGETNEHGTCQAALGTTGTRKCFNTRFTCQDPANYAPAAHVVRFTKPRANERRDRYLLPLLVGASTAPTRINPGGGDRSRGVLGDRATVDLTFRDAPSTDRALDKYFRERFTGEAIGDGDPDAESGITDRFLFNGDFEDGDTGWTVKENWVIENDPVNARNGAWVARAPAGAGALRNDWRFTVEEGDVIVAQAWCRLAAGADGNVFVRFSMRDASGAEVRVPAGNLVTGTSYELSRVTATVQAGEVAAQVELVRGFETTGDGFADDASFGGYDPLDRSTFWAKWLKRNPYYQNRKVRILEGYEGQAFAAMRTREYFIDAIDGPDHDGRVRVRAKDVLKLAEDERAQAPTQSPGELNAALAVGTTTSFQATGAVIADYPDEPGLVRVGDEVIEYQTRTQVDSNTVEFQTLTRGARGSAANDHDAEDRVQRCLEYVNALCWEVVEDLLVNFGNVPAAFVPSADWDAEGSVWLQQFTVTAVITEPTSVTQLVSELAQQCQFFIWWDEHAQEIRLRALRTPTETPAKVGDDFEIMANSSELRTEPNQRLSQVWVFFGQRDPTERLDDEGNYRRVRIRADLEAESSDLYGEPRIRKIFSRWLESEIQALQVAVRTLARYRDNPRFLRVRLDAKDRTITTGDVVDATTRTVVDDRGVAEEVRYQVVSAKEEPVGEAVTLDLQLYEFTGRFAFQMAEDAPDFANATEEEKRSGAWLAKADGTMPDGTPGYQLQ